MIFHQASPKPFTGEPLNEDQSIEKKHLFRYSSTYSQKILQKWIKYQLELSLGWMIEWMPRRVRIAWVNQGLQYPGSAGTLSVPQKNLFSISEMNTVGGRTLWSYNSKFAGMVDCKFPPGRSRVEFHKDRCLPIVLWKDYHMHILEGTISYLQEHTPHLSVQYLVLLATPYEPQVCEHGPLSVQSLHAPPGGQNILSCTHWYIDTLHTCVDNANKNLIWIVNFQVLILDH